MSASEERAVSLPAVGFTSVGPIDLTDLKRLGGSDSGLAGSRDFMHDIIELFLQLAPKIHGTAVAAVQDRDGGSLASACHKLKSQAAYFGAQRLVLVCKQLEEMGLNGDIRRAEATLHDLEDELDRVVAALQPHRQPE